MSAMSRNQVRELWMKPVPETKYLNSGNVERYRLVMRCFYRNYGKLKYWLRPEDVYEEVLSYGLLEEYTLEECQRDLDVLTEWKNLTTRHDGGRATTIEEYLRKRFRYQMTPYAIEIERMLESLENLQGYGGSLEPTLLERIVGYVTRIRERNEPYRDGEAGLLWRDLHGAFRQLHENASDYLASLQTAKAEELMLTQQFLVYKDTLTHYLRNFMLGLQTYGSQLEGMFRDTERAVWDSFLEAVVQDDLRTPSLEDTGSEEDRRQQRREEWDVLMEWFIGRNGESSDVLFLERATKETIAKMVRYALAIQEKQAFGVSRKRELDHLGQWFFRLDNLEDAQRLSAFAFGLFKTRHFQGEFEVTSDSADVSMWEEVPMYRELASRSRVRRSAADTEVVREMSTEKQRAREQVLAQKAAMAAVAQTFVEMGEFALSDLKVLSSQHRQVLLTWISRCMVRPSRVIHTPEGLEVRLTVPEARDRTTIHFDDGQLELPNFRLSVRGVS
jgi:uncharacterized protein (TIGR02677 family)